tara:strand:- start:2680 stop:4206 length:1527 start_codon:yes stop_codon:yes gene_type:complete
MLLAEPALIATIAWLPVDDLPSGMWANFWANVWSWQGLLVAFAIVGEILAVMFVYRVLVRGGSAASTLLWMVLILATPWLGLMFYYLLPRTLQLRRLRRTQQSERRLREVRPLDDGNPEPPKPTSGLDRLLQCRGGLSEGNALRWLPRGEDFFAAASAAIGKAEQHVHCVVYILRPDSTGLRFLELLTEAATRGVKVRLCFDSVGSWGLKTAHLRPLRAAGGQAVPFLPLLWKRRPFTLNLRNHRKLLVVDGSVAFLGGRNIADEYRHDRVGKRRRWYDAMMEVRGPAVDWLQDVFVQDWCTAADEVLPEELAGGTSRSPCDPAGTCRVGIVSSGPDDVPSALSFALFQAIGEAHTTITLSSPYLVMPSTLQFALQLAVARGVKVRIYTNGPCAEAAFLYHAQRHHYRQLLESGLELYETIKEYNHTKFLVVDDSTVCIGSANLDLRSANLNFELAAVALNAEPLAAAIQATVEQRQACFQQVTPESLPSNPFWRAIDGGCALFSPLL